VNAEQQAEFCEHCDPQMRPCRACYGCLGWERREQANLPEHLRTLLAEAVEWARRPSPIPMVPFNDFLNRCGEVGVGPRAIEGSTESNGH
jgi:hypothetical protein